MGFPWPEAGEAALRALRQNHMFKDRFPWGRLRLKSLPTTPRFPSWIALGSLRLRQKR